MRKALAKIVGGGPERLPEGDELLVEPSRHPIALSEEDLIAFRKARASAQAGRVRSLESMLAWLDSL